jgi:hypothetical protein
MTTPGIKVSQLQATVSSLWKSLAAMFEVYRPEQHYMRGPGPKWHAKYQPN